MRDHHLIGSAPASGELADAALRLIELVGGRSLGLVQVPATDPQSAYEPGDHLDGRLVTLIRDACESGTHSGLAVGLDRVGFDPGTGRFVAADDQWIDRFASGGAPTRFATFRSGPDDRLGSCGVSASAALWRAAILSSAGRRPSPVASDRRLLLDSWPEIGWMASVAGSLRILASMARGPISIDELVEKGHERHIVNALVSALVVTGVVIESSALLGDWIAPEPSEPRSPGFLRRILGGDSSS